jgi:hypothetical protein
VAVSIWIGASIAVAAVAAGMGARRLARGSGLGVAAGLLYAAGDVGTKVAVHGGGRLVFVPIVLALHGLAFVALQLGFQRGGPLATAGVATLLTNALPIAAGVVLLHETLARGPLGALRVLAFAAVVAAAAALAGGDRTERAPARTRKNPIRRTAFAGASAHSRSRRTRRRQHDRVGGGPEARRGSHR